VLVFSVVDKEFSCCGLFAGYLIGEGNVGLPDGRWWRFLYCSLINVISLVVCLIGAGMFAKTSVAVLGIVCISLLSVIISFCIQSPKKVNAM
jgi:potassium/chloride transporter 9